MRPSMVAERNIAISHTVILPTLSNSDTSGVIDPGSAVEGSEGQGVTIMTGHGKHGKTAHLGTICTRPMMHDSAQNTRNAEI